jgi:Zn-dependent protease with chaperone function
VDAGVFVPFVVPLIAWPLARAVTAGAGPKAGAWLLTVAALMLAAGSTASLAVLAFAGLSLVPAVAAGEWSTQALGSMEIASVPVEVIAAVALVAVAAAAIVWLIRRVRWLRGVGRTIDGLPAEAGLVVLADAPPLAFAVPLKGGRIVVSRSMLAALTSAERAALLTHERAHLRGRHHLFLAAVALATAVNPLLRPLRSAVIFLVERWADEVTCRRMGDRHVVASAVGKAALAARAEVPFVPAAVNGPVPRRVAALLNPPPRVDRRWGASVCAAAAVALIAWSAQASVEAAADLHAGIELASVAHHHHGRHAVA